MEKISIKKIIKLFHLLSERPPKKRPNFLIFGENKYLYSKDKTLQFAFSRDLADVGFKPDRGKIINFFSMIELLINYIILYWINPNSPFSFQEIMDNIDLFTKVKLLKQWGIINNKEKEKILTIKEVRNGFAHVMVTTEISYKGVQIDKNFTSFKKDLKSILEILLEKYKKVQPDIDELIELLSRDKKNDELFKKFMDNKEK